MLPSPNQILDDAIRTIFPAVRNPETGSLEARAGNDTAYKNLRFLADCAPAVLVRVAKSCSNPEVLRVWQNTLQKQNLCAAGSPEYERVMDEYERMLVVLPAVARIAAYDDQARDVRSSIPLVDRAVKQLIKVSKLSPLPTRDELAAIALLLYVRGAHSLATYTSGSTELTYDEIKTDIVWIARHLEETITLIPILVERGTHSHDFIATLLASSNAPLANGTL